MSDFGSDEDDIHDEMDLPPCKRRKLSEEERLRRSRERNRIHARNTRERKKLQMEYLQSRIHSLVEERKRLRELVPRESSIAEILMSLSGCGSSDSSNDPLSDVSIENIRHQVALILSGDDEFNAESNITGKEKSHCSSAEIESIRRERNRMHAKKTRLRKKKMLQAMESIASQLEVEVDNLRKSNFAESKSSRLDDDSKTSSDLKGNLCYNSSFCDSKSTDESSSLQLAEIEPSPQSLIHPSYMSSFFAPALAPPVAPVSYGNICPSYLPSWNFSNFVAGNGSTEENFDYGMYGLNDVNFHALCSTLEGWQRLKEWYCQCAAMSHPISHN